MSKKKQIKSTDWLTRGIPKEQLERKKQEAIMSAYLREYFAELSFDFDGIAEKMVAIGYRKQSEGEWIAKDNINGKCSIAICSNCGTEKGLPVLLPIETVTRDFPYCEKCGAKMKAEEKKEAQKYFSPEDVRKMSSSEVKANYQAILDSMKKWE